MIQERRIPGFPGYLVNEFGVVRREVVGLRMKAGALSQIDSHAGYKKVSVVNSAGERKLRFVHCLVAAAFIGRKPEGLQVCHKDGDKRNNNYRNLRYDTPVANAQDAVQMGRYERGSKRKNAVLNELQVAQIVEALKRGASPSAIARRFGVVYSTIGSIAHGRRWTHVTQGVRIPINPKPGNRKLTVRDVLEIRSRCAEAGVSSGLAAQYGITYANLWCIARRKTWRHI